MTMKSQPSPDDNDAESKEDTLTNTYDPTARLCGWCYAMLLPSQIRDEACKCADCPRHYCSPDCCRSDASTHSFWCGKAGEKGVDFDVCDIAGGAKGLGLVTRRSFARGEKILAERPILTTANATNTHKATSITNSSIHNNPNIRTAAMALTPLHATATLDDKITANGVSVASNPSDKRSGLFLTFSRVNHDCVGNSDHFFDHQHGVQVLVANDVIPAGAEITFPYARTGKQRFQDLHWRGFTCDCRACREDNDDEDNWGDKVNQIVELEKDINALNGQSQDRHRQQAVQSATKMLELYQELGVSDREYARTHYDLFQILVLQKQSLKDAQKHITKAHQHALRFCGYEGHETVKTFRHYRDNPESHGNYRALG